MLTEIYEENLTESVSTEEKLHTFPYFGHVQPSLQTLNRFMYEASADYMTQTYHISGISYPMFSPVSAACTETPSE